MKRTAFFVWAAIVAITGACSDFELKKMGGAGEPCFENGLCDAGLVCVDGWCVPVSIDVDNMTDTPIADTDELLSDTGEPIPDIVDTDEPIPDVVDTDETLIDGDDSDADYPDGTDVDITSPVCGNGVVESGEECDDGNTTNGDGCSANCTIEPPDSITDLRVEYTGTVDTVRAAWTAPGPHTICYDSYRVCLDSYVLCSDHIATQNVGEEESIVVSVPWYSGTHSISVQPTLAWVGVGSTASIEFSTDLAIQFEPNDKIDFGTIGYNSTKDITVTITNTAELVDLVLNQIYLPMDCGGKVTIVSGTVTPSNRVILAPGTSHEVLLRYAPTEESSCSSGDRLQIQWVASGNPYVSKEIPIVGNAINTPPTVWVEFTKNPVKKSDGTTRVIIHVSDDNSICSSPPVYDIVEGVWDLSDIGALPRQDLPSLSCESDSHHFYYWTDIPLSSLSDGIYVLPITITDTAGHTVRLNASFAVYSGNLLEVGAGKTYTTIGAAFFNFQNGDIIVVYPGIYTGTANTDVSPNGKDILLYGIAGPDETVIDLENGAASAFRLTGGGTNSVIGGFRVINGGSGSAVYVDASYNPQSLILTNCRIEDNGGNIGGGAGLFAQKSNADIHVLHSAFVGNSATSFGAAVYVTDGARASFSDVLFTTSSAQSAAAFAAYNPGDILFDRCAFTENTASASTGGAIGIDGDTRSATVTLRNVVIAGNSAAGHGGALFINHPALTLNIYNSTIAENSASGTSAKGGGIAMWQGTLVMKDTILFFNTAASASQLFMNDDGSGGPETTGTIDNCAIGGAADPIGDTAKRINNPTGFVAGQRGNITNDPIFIGSGEGVLKYLLKSTSPCIDTSSDSSSVPLYDFLGNQRRNIPGKGDGMGIEADIGAFEYQP